MKKTITSIMLLLCVQLVSSQFKAGYNIGASSFSLNSDTFETESQISPQFGIHSRYIIDDKTEILAELSVNLSKYTVTGTEFNENRPVGTQDYKFKHTSVMVGVYYTYNLINQNFSVFAGPAFSGSLSNKVIDNLDNKDVRFGDVSEDFDAGLDARQVADLSPYYYLSAGITGGVENIKLRLRYDFSLSKAYDDVTYDFSSRTLEGSTSFISLAFLYSFDIY